MKSLLVIVIAAATMGCSAIGTYAGMDIGMGYGHNFGNGGNSFENASAYRFGNHKLGSSSSSFSGGSQYPDDTISTSVTILLRPKKEN